MERYYEDHPIEEFKNESQFLGLMGLRVMQGNPEAALQILNEAIDADDLFVNSLQDPIYDKVRALEGYPAAEARLRQLAMNWSLTETKMAQSTP